MLQICTPTTYSLKSSQMVNSGRVDGRVLLTCGTYDATFYRVFFNPCGQSIEGEIFDKTANNFLSCSIHHSFQMAHMNLADYSKACESLRVVIQGNQLLLTSSLFGGGQMCATERKDVQVQNSRFEESVEVSNEVEHILQTYEKSFRSHSDELSTHLEGTREYEQTMEDRERLVNNTATEINAQLKKLLVDQTKNYEHLLLEYVTKIFNMRDATQLFAKTKGCFKICIRAYGILEFDEGTYEGDWDVGAARGKGSIVFANGERFVGEWIRDETYLQYADTLRFGHPHGQGKYVFDTVGKKGDTSETTINTTGASTTRGGSSEELTTVKYSGQWIRGDKHGFGKEVYSDGSTFEGNWNTNIKGGQGALISGKGHLLYQGEYRAGIENGVGKFFYADTGAIKYEGEILAGAPHGKGMFSWKDGDKYTGEWKSGEIEGEGTFIRGNGEKYTGKFVDGEKSGYGEYTYKNAEVYKGDWKENERHGSGILYNPDGGVVHEGFWEYNDPL